MVGPGCQMLEHQRVVALRCGLDERHVWMRFRVLFLLVFLRLRLWLLEWRRIVGPLLRVRKVCSGSNRASSTPS